MNVKEYAKASLVSIDKIIKNAKQLGLTLNRQTKLGETEKKILDKISFMSIAEIRGYKEGLSDSTPEEILESLQNDFPNKTHSKISDSENDQYGKFNFEKSNAQISKSDLRTNDLTKDVEKAVSQVKMLENRIASLEDAMLQIKGLENRINSIEEILLQIVDNDDQNLEYHQLRDRIAYCIEQSYKSSCQFPNIRDIADIQKDYLKINLAYSKEFLEDVASALASGKHIIIVGPTGIGKTSFLKKMNLFYETKLGHQVKINYHTVFSDWDSYDILGGKKLLKSKLVPHIGIFLETVLECIESNQNLLFILDELSRGKVDDMFSGLVDYLNGNLNLMFKEFELVVEGAKSLKVPQGVKLICAMNNADFNHLYHISTQIMRRFSVIKFDRNDNALEHRIINKLLHDSKNKFTDNRYRQMLDNYGVIIKQIRQIEDDMDLDYPIFGTSYIVDAIKVLETNIANGYAINIDDIFNNTILSKIRDLRPDVKNNLSRIFEEKKMPNCVKVLNKSL